MLSEITVSTLLTASITGAGLIIAIYALITPISRKIFDDKIALLRMKKKEFDKLKVKVSSDSSDKEFERLKKLASEIKKIKTFPKYLGIGVILVFVCYQLTVSLCFGWLAFSGEREMYEFWITLFFWIATMGFLFVGIDAVIDVYWAMKGEFEKVKKEKEEVEKDSEELEKAILEEFKRGRIFVERTRLHKKSEEE